LRLTNRVKARDLSPLLILAGIFAAWLFWLAVSTGYRNTDVSDFQAFYRSGLAWRSTSTIQTGLVDRPNLNPPSVVALVFAPLSRLSQAHAYAIWTITGLLLLAWCLWIIPASPRAKAWACVWLGASVPAFWTWHEGQITWLLLPFVTYAWVLSRRGEFVQAGVCLAPAIAIKPTLALLALALPWPIWLTAGVGSLALSIGSVAFTGVQPWRDWFALSRTITWFGNPMNGSVWGLADRFAWSQLDTGIMIACVVALLLLIRRLPHDARWIGAVLCATLLSPLGWVGYLAIGLGPVLTLHGVSRPFRVLLVASLLPWTVPLLWFGPTPLVKSLYGGVVLLAMLTLVTAHPMASPQTSELDEAA